MFAVVVHFVSSFLGVIAAIFTDPLKPRYNNTLELISNNFIKDTREEVKISSDILCLSFSIIHADG